jgi:hypothetical protein
MKKPHLTIASRLTLATALAAIFCVQNAVAEFPHIRRMTRLGGNLAESAKTIAGANTNVFVAGNFGAVTTVGGTSLTNNSGHTNFFVTKCDFYCTPNWATAPTIDGPIGTVKMAPLTSGMLVAGTFFGTNFTFGSQTITNAATDGATLGDIFFLQLNSVGGVTWLKQAGGTGADAINDAAVNVSSGYLTGWFKSPSFAVGYTNLILLGTNLVDGFVIKISSSGSLTWAKQIVNGMGNLIAFDTANNGYVAGSVLGEVAFDGLVLSNQTDGTFLAKFNSTGTPLWIRGDLKIGNNIAMDKLQNIVTVGTLTNNLQFAPGTTLSDTNAATAYIAKYDSAGGFLWARAIPGLGNDQAVAVTVDSRTNYWVSGNFRSANLGEQHLFAAVYDMNGQMLGLTQAAGASVSRIVDMDNTFPPSSFNNFACGTFATNVTVSGLALTNSGDTDIFLAGFDMVPPALATTVTNDRVIVSWPATTEGYTNSVLEAATDASLGTWVPATNTIGTADGQNYITNSTTADKAFYRLKLQSK